MRYGVIARSLLALSFRFPDAIPPPTSSQTGITAAEDARWSEETAKQLREAIDRRAAHGLDRMRFEVAGDRR